VKDIAGMTWPDAPIRLGVSSCLLGARVRFDGGHKRDQFLVGLLGRFVEWVPVCPELESGMGAPREALRLTLRHAALRLVTTKTAQDHTELMRRYSAKRLDELAEERLRGFVVKKDSPTCGLERVRVYNASGVPTRSGRGLFAGALIERFPLLPVEEEGRLSDPKLRENFIERVFAYDRLTRLFDGPWTLGDLVQFHTAHKMTLLAHVPDAYRRLGQLVARATSMRRPALERDYMTLFMETLRVIATRRRQVNVLQHMLGHLKDALDAESRHELLGVISAYAAGHVPLVVPITLMRHHVRRCDIAYLAGQVYLDPHPAELMLRNHV
jgi:uncharacterized protein YbgA (DUF1722 family)/uncharacterized protein YbbK (DUF523 family)